MTEKREEQLTITSLLSKMNSDCKKYLKLHMRVKLKKELHISTGSLHKFLPDGKQECDFSQINVKTPWIFTDFNRKKFVNSGILDQEEKTKS